MATICAVEQFPATGRTGRDIRWNLGSARSASALSHYEVEGERVIDRLLFAHINRIDASESGRIVRYCLDQSANSVRFTLNLDLDSTGIVQYPASELFAVGEPPDKRTKANALNDTYDVNGVAPL